MKALKKLIAEDFHVIFERGSDKELNGNEVQMALWLAVQELNTKVNEKDTEIQEMKDENNAKQEQINALKQLVCLDHPTAPSC
ncbi:hypothetical protein KJ671_03335 [Patescibacteria group bacterium]|nr:hypothetical protein [Patescibacteria group bacterium]